MNYKRITLFIIISIHVLYLVAQKVQSSLPDTFGKTHFIVGYTPSEDASPASQEKSQQLASENTEKHVSAPVSKKLNQSISKSRVLFSPDDNLQQALLELIKQEQKGIKVAIYLFTDPLIAQELVQARLRGVAVEVVADQSSLADRYGQLATLQDGGIPIAIYKGEMVNGNYSSLMHNKFVLFERSENDQSLAWTGSFNFTKTARLYNQENAVIIDDHHMIECFHKQFDRLKKRCTVYMKNTMRKPSVKSTKQVKQIKSVKSDKVTRHKKKIAQSAVA